MMSAGSWALINVCINFRRLQERPVRELSLSRNATHTRILSMPEHYGKQRAGDVEDSDEELFAELEAELSRSGLVVDWRQSLDIVRPRGGVRAMAPVGRSCGSY